MKDLHVLFQNMYEVRVASWIEGERAWYGVWDVGRFSTLQSFESMGRGWVLSLLQWEILEVENWTDYSSFCAQNGLSQAKVHTMQSRSGRDWLCISQNYYLFGGGAGGAVYSSENIVGRYFQTNS